jgi:hypothetical protein
MKLCKALGLETDEFDSPLFTAESIAAVERLFVERGNKTYVRCQIRGKEVLAKPEEVVRQLWIAALMYQFDYPSLSQTCFGMYPTDWRNKSPQPSPPAAKPPHCWRRPSAPWRSRLRIRRQQR